MKKIILRILRVFLGTATLSFGIYFVGVSNEALPILAGVMLIISGLTIIIEKTWLLKFIPEHTLDIVSQYLFIKILISFSVLMTIFSGFLLGDGTAVIFMFACAWAANNHYPANISPIYFFKKIKNWFSPLKWFRFSKKVTSTTS